MQSYLLKTKAQLANQLYIKLKNTFKNVFYLKNYYISIYKNKLKSKMFWFQLAKNEIKNVLVSIIKNKLNYKIG